MRSQNDQRKCCFEVPQCNNWPDVFISTHPFSLNHHFIVHRDPREQGCLQRPMQGSSSSLCKHKSTQSLMSALHSHHSLSLLGTLDSQSELQALFKRKAFIPQTKEWVIWKLSLFSGLHCYIFPLSFVLDYSTLAPCTEIHCSFSVSVQSWAVMDPLKVRVTGWPFNFVAADLSLFLCPQAHTSLHTGETALHWTPGDWISYYTWKCTILSR